MSFGRVLNTSLADVGAALVCAGKNRIVQGVAVAAVLGMAISKIRKNSARAAFMAKVKAQRAGEVHIYIPMGRLMEGLPHVAPNFLKIESFCRIHKIPYHMEAGGQYAAFSPTETMPFISLDGKLVGESQFCVDAIAKRFNVPAQSAREQAISVLVRKTLDLSMSQHLNRMTFVDNRSIVQKFMAEKFAPALGIPAFMVPFGFSQYRKAVINRLNTSGLGWLDDERYQIELVRDIEAIASFVAESQANGHKYLTGPKPTSTDALLYGHIASIQRIFGKGATVNTAGLTAMATNPALTKFVEDFEEEVYPDLKSIAPCGSGTQSFPKKKDP